MDPLTTPVKIGLLPTGHKMYWGQYPGLKDMGMAMYNKLFDKLSGFGRVVSPGLADTDESAALAAGLFVKEQIDILIIFPFGYTTGMMIVPAIQAVSAPILLLNAHEDASYNYKNADTATYLHHEGACCIPEYAGTLVLHKKRFHVLSGHFGQPTFWEDIKRRCDGAAAATVFAAGRYGVIGGTYTGMVDMPVDDHRILLATGRLPLRPEVEEIEEAVKRVSAVRMKAMLDEFRASYDVDGSVTDAHMEVSAKIAAAFDEVIGKYGINAFGFYWWGEKPYMTELRAQAALGVSRLTAMGIPGVTEGDIKAAMAMRILNLLGGGGMFCEFFSADYEEEFLLMGHDGPSNVMMADGKPKLTQLTTHHGKTGEGLGIDFNMRPGVCTLLNLTQFGTDKVFKLIYTIGEVVGGDILNIGNPNCRVKINKPIPEFINAWCQQGPGHHTAMGKGDFSVEIETFAQKMDFECVRV